MTLQQDSSARAVHTQSWNMVQRQEQHDEGMEDRWRENDREAPAFILWSAFTGPALLFVTEVPPRHRRACHRDAHGVRRSRSSSSACACAPALWARAALAAACAPACLQRGHQSACAREGPCRDQHPQPCVQRGAPPARAALPPAVLSPGSAQRLGFMQESGMHANSCKAIQCNPCSWSAQSSSHWQPASEVY